MNALPTVIVRRIRRLFVVGYWESTPHCYWGDKRWTPLSDHKNCKAALRALDAIRQRCDERAGRKI